MDYNSFYDLTPREIRYWLDSKRQGDFDNLKTQSALTYWLARQVAVAFHKPGEMARSFKEAFPLLAEDRRDEDIQQQLFVEGARRYNKRKE